MLSVYFKKLQIVDYLKTASLNTIITIREGLLKNYGFNAGIIWRSLKIVGKARKNI